MASDSLGGNSQKQGYAQAFLLFVVSFGSVIGLGTQFQWLSLMQFGDVSAGLAATEILLIMLPALLFVRFKGVSLTEGLRLRRVSLSIAGLSILMGVGVWGIAFTLYQLLLPITGEFPDAGLVHKTLPSFCLLLLCGAVLPGICEEILFRGVIQSVLSRRGSMWAIVVTSVLFGLFHLHPSNIIPPILIGIVLGLLVERTGSIVPAMLLHFATNATAFTMSYFLGDAIETSIVPLCVCLATLFGITAVVAWRLTSSCQPEPSPMTFVAAALRDIPKRTRRIAGALGTASIIVVLVGTFQCVGSYVMANDRLAPEVRKGDVVIVLKQRWIESEIKPGDIVTFSDEGKTFLRKVAKTDEAKVWIVRKESKEPIERSRITGKVFRIITRSRKE